MDLVEDLVAFNRINDARFLARARVKRGVRVGNRELLVSLLNPLGQRSVLLESANDSAATWARSGMRFKTCFRLRRKLSADERLDLIDLQAGIHAALL
jgi:hypothetical protein